MLVVVVAEMALKVAHLVLAVRAAAAQALLRRAYLERLTLVAAVAVVGHHMVVAALAVLALSSFATPIRIPTRRQRPGLRGMLIQAVTKFTHGLTAGASPSNGFHNRRSCP
jgi:hypothetical protein